MAPWRNNDILIVCATGCLVFLLRNLLTFHVQNECGSFNVFLSCTTTTTREEQFSLPSSRQEILNSTHEIRATNSTNQGELIRKVDSSHLDNDSVKIPFPAFLASLPKSGTTTVHYFFRCGRVHSVHTYCPRKNGTLGTIGVVMERNVKNGRPPFQGCGDTLPARHGIAKVFTDHGYVANDGRCYYPSIHSLDALYAAYPNMTLMLATRNVTSWYQSLVRWNGGNLLHRWKLHCPFMPNNTASQQQEFEDFYHWHTRHVRTFAQQHPSVTYLEFSIDSPTVGEYLEEQTGISADCWGHFHPNSRINSVANKTKRGKQANAA